MDREPLCARCDGYYHVAEGDDLCGKCCYIPAVLRCPGCMRFLSTVSGLWCTYGADSRNTHATVVFDKGAWAACCSDCGHTRPIEDILDSQPGAAAGLCYSYPEAKTVVVSLDRWKEVEGRYAQVKIWVKSRGGTLKRE